MLSRKKPCRACSVCTTVAVSGVPSRGVYRRRQQERHPDPSGVSHHQCYLQGLPAQPTVFQDAGTTERRSQTIKETISTWQTRQTEEEK